MERVRRVQGDVFFYLASIPEDAEKTEKKVLAEGEATGHNHVLEKTQDVEMFEKEGTLYLKVASPAKVIHPEHKEVTIPEGTWGVGIVREVDPFTEETRRVSD